MPELTVTVAQINPTVGDIEANAQAIIQYANYAKNEGSDCVVFPELCLTGYPPEDLLLRPALHQRVSAAIKNIANTIEDIQIIIGAPLQTPNGIINAAVVIANKSIVTHYTKQCLPNYGVFDEKRYFIAGNEPVVIKCKAYNIGIAICEDLWHTQPAQKAKSAGADILISLNASPFNKDKQKLREATICQRASEIKLPIIYVNCVGGQDELIFDGASFVANDTGKVAWRAKSFQEELHSLKFSGQKPKLVDNLNLIPLMPQLDAIYTALKLGTHDYVTKNGFKGALIGLSGGIDSALTAAIAVDALGAANVHCVIMPSRYTANISVEDAKAQSESMGTTHTVIDIEPMFKQFLTALSPIFKDKKPDTTEENIQARIRGVLLMSLSNKFGDIVLTTGNKSELAVGYSTLYGDMAGGFGILKDIPKTMVYALAKWRNNRSDKQIIPARVLERPASAELSENQCDQDTLPDYKILDEILERYVEHDESISTICNAGFARETVIKVTQMINNNEYKRRQGAPGIRISPRAFGKDRRYPITSNYWRKNASF